MPPNRANVIWGIRGAAKRNDRCGLFADGESPTGPHNGARVSGDDEYCRHLRQAAGERRHLCRRFAVHLPCVAGRLARNPAGLSWPFDSYLRFSFIPDTIKAYDRSFREASRGKYFNIRMLYAVLIPLISLYHGDGLSSGETPAKCVLLAYVDSEHGEISLGVFICGVAAGAVIAAGSAMIDLGFHHALRPIGPINPIRFGMITLAFGAVSAVALLHARDRFMAAVALAGSLAGIAAAFMSGSRGALLALPVILLLLAPVLWRRSRRIFLTVSVFLAVFATRDAGRQCRTHVDSDRDRLCAAIRADQRRRESGRPFGRRPHQAALAVIPAVPGKAAARRRREGVERRGRAAYERAGPSRSHRAALQPGAQPICRRSGQRRHRALPARPR